MKIAISNREVNLLQRLLFEISNRAFTLNFIKNNMSLFNDKILSNNEQNYTYFLELYNDSLQALEKKYNLANKKYQINFLDSCLYIIEKG